METNLPPLLGRVYVNLLEGNLGTQGLQIWGWSISQDLRSVWNSFYSSTRDIWDPPVSVPETSERQKIMAGWWFGTWIAFFPYIGNCNPNWLFVFFRWVGMPPSWLGWSEKASVDTMVSWSKCGASRQISGEPILWVNPGPRIEMRPSPKSK